jgi:hypothetical protein
MALTRQEHDEALEAAVVELAQALGLDMNDASSFPGVNALARLFYQRRAEREAELRRGQEEYEQRERAWAAQQAAHKAEIDAYLERQARERSPIDQAMDAALPWRRAARRA